MSIWILSHRNPQEHVCPRHNRHSGRREGSPKLVRTPPHMGQSTSSVVALETGPACWGVEAGPQRRPHNPQGASLCFFYAAVLNPPKEDPLPESKIRLFPERCQAAQPSPAHQVGTGHASRCPRPPQGPSRRPTPPLPSRCGRWPGRQRGRTPPAASAGALGETGPGKKTGKQGTG